MVRFAPDRERWGHMEFDTEFDQMQSILDLVKGLPNVLNLMFKEINVPGSDKPKPEKEVKDYPHFGDMRIWNAVLKTVFEKAKANGNGEIRVDDPRIVEALTSVGRKATSASPLVSYLRKAGLLVRCGKGTYRLP